MAPPEGPELELQNMAFLMKRRLRKCKRKAMLRARASATRLGDNAEMPPELLEDLNRLCDALMTKDAVSKEKGSSMKDDKATLKIDHQRCAHKRYITHISVPSPYNSGPKSHPFSLMQSAATVAASALRRSPYSLLSSQSPGRGMTSALKKSAVLYHYPCPDGAFAALAAHLYFSATSLPVLFFPNADYDPISDVYLLDFVGPSGFVAEISTKVESVTILDHHKTAFEDLCGNVLTGQNVTMVIDMNQSGATIAFDFFKEKLLASNDISKDPEIQHHMKGRLNLVPDSKIERVHKLFKYVEDGDLWRWALPYSKAFASGLKDMKIEYNVNVNSAVFDQVNGLSISFLGITTFLIFLKIIMYKINLLALDPEHVIGIGKQTLTHKQRLINEVLQQSYKIRLGNGLFGQCLVRVFHLYPCS
ncbi:hypothetical protein MUK42_21524 [Musa troglodytarum]|uniref:Uncharacterized protein n=2 Tax=Musa troglodytarum TaxID=320322 RepID=A0A9E7FT50_9LILI|nr:hypothetical protein MUK42_21524 [Musa troglodytarum]